LITDNEPQRSWVVELLPYIDAQNVYDRWDTSQSLAFNDDATTGLGPFNIPVLGCPNDDSAFQVAGGLSYVVNAGFDDGLDTEHNYIIEALDWNDDGNVPPNANPDTAFDLAITKATGVFWAEYAVDPLESAGLVAPAVPVPVKRPSSNLGRIYDGSSNTLMMGENLMAGEDLINTTINNAWASPEYRSCTFVAPVTLAAGTPSLDFAGGGYTVKTGNTFGTTNPITVFPNKGKFAVEGDTPSLNSLHPGVVVVTMCDGAVRTLSESIDQGVYLRLMTPGATKLKATLTSGAELPLSGTDF
jgi:hypothetical protein